MHGRSEPTEANRKKAPKSKDAKSPLAGHPHNHARRAYLDEIRDALARLPESEATSKALGILNGMTPESSLQSWLALHGALGGLDPHLESCVLSAFRLTRSDILSSAKTGADIIPALHLACSDFMKEYCKCLDSWRAKVREVAARLDVGAELGGEISNYIINMARSGSKLEGDDAFVVMVQEVCARHGRYGTICHICREILEFEGKDWHNVIAYSHVELAIASLAEHAIAVGRPDDSRVIEECADILRRRAKDINADVPLPKDGRLTFEAIAKSARHLAQCRNGQSASPWREQRAASYPFMQEVARHSPPMDSPSWPAIKTEKEGFCALKKTATEFKISYMDRRESLRNVINPEAQRIVMEMPFDADLRRYIVEMARFGSGAIDGLVRFVLVHLCIKRKMYTAVHDVCEEMNEFGGLDAQRMAASTIIENVIKALLNHIMLHDPKSGNDVVKKCAKLLKKRSESLGLGLYLDEEDSNVRVLAKLFARDIAARRRGCSSKEICSWIRKDYRLSYDFLKLGKKGDGAISPKSILAWHVSGQIGNLERGKTYKVNGSPPGALDPLEALLETMHRIGLDPKENSKEWRRHMLSRGFWSALLEMGMFVHCHAKSRHRVVPHPKINDKKSSADLLVGNCYIEAYSPSSTLKHIDCVVEEHLRHRLLSKITCNIMEKSQIESFDGCYSILAVGCDPEMFDEQYMHDLLKKRVERRPYLGGILLVLRNGDRYETCFISNDEASMKVPEDIVRDICDALEKSV